MTYKSSSAASDVSLAPFGLRIIRAMQPSAARGKTAECTAEQLYIGNLLRRVRFAHSDRIAARPRGVQQYQLSIGETGHIQPALTAAAA